MSNSPCPTHNSEKIQATSIAEEANLLQYVKELEGKGRKPDELLRLLQLAVDTDEKEEESF